MRKPVKYALLLVIVVMSFGCRKDDSAVPAKIINVALKNTETYNFDLGGFGDEEGASVITQAVHAEISKTERTPNGGVAYYYKPKASFTGTDFTVIGIYKGSDGATPSRLVETVKFKFTVTD